MTAFDGRNGQDMKKSIMVVAAVLAMARINAEAGALLKREYRAGWTLNR